MLSNTQIHVTGDFISTEMVSVPQKMNSTLCYTIFPLFVVGVLLSWVAPAYSDLNAKKTPSCLLFLRVGADVAHIEQEQKLIDELALVLDDICLIQKAVTQEDFLAQPLPQQLPTVTALVRQTNAPVAIWLARLAAQGGMIQVVFPNSDAATIRTFWAESPGSLALGIREMLAAPPLTTETEPKAKMPTSRDDPPADAQFGITTLFEAGGGLVGSSGASFNWGAGIGVDWTILDGFFLRAAFVAKVGPLKRTEQPPELVVGSRFEPRISLGLMWPMAFLSLGPVAQIAALRSSMDLSLGQGDNQQHIWWGWRAALGGRLVWRVREMFAFELGITVGYLQLGKSFKRTSNHTEVLRTPLFDMTGWLAANYLF